MSAAAVSLFAFLAAHSGEGAARLLAEGRMDPSQWQEREWSLVLADEQRVLLPMLPLKLRRALSADARALLAEMASGHGRRAALERHADSAAAALRSLVAEGAAIARRIYLDNAATTPVDPRVAERVYAAMVDGYGNPHSADHAFGDQAASLVEGARCNVAALLGCDPGDVHLTSGASESIRLGLGHLVRQIAAERRRRVRVAYLPLEHRAVLQALEAMRDQGFAELDPLTVDTLGRVAGLPDGAYDLVCMMGGNNEIGNVYPVAEVADWAHRRGARMFADLTQYAGRVPIDLGRTGIDAAVMSGHKIYGPKGAGALVLRGASARGFELPTGTPSVPAIAGLGEAAKLRRAEAAVDEVRIASLRDRLMERLDRAGLGIVRNGDPSSQLAGALHVSVPRCWGDALLACLRDKVAASTAAACASGRGMRSHVLDALGLEPWRVRGAIRFSVGRFNDATEIELAADAVIDAVKRVRS